MARYATSISRRKPEREARDHFGAFDVETDGLDGAFILLTAQYELPDHSLSTTEIFNTPKQFIDWILADPHRRKVIWFAHNAEYDWRYFIPALVDYLPQYHITPRVRGLNKIYEIDFLIKNTVKDYALRMRDSLAVFPFPLKDFASKFSTRAKLDIGLAEGSRFNRHNPVHMEYAIRDTEVLLESMINYDKLVYDAFGVHLKGTTASTAYNGFLRHIPEEQKHYRIGSTADEFVRRAYFGGIVYIRHINQHIPEVRTYDINSSYPNVMERFGVPCGRATFVEDFLPRDIPAFYEVEVDATGIPDEKFHFIAKRESHSICWARGIFTTSITSNEYYTALEYGYKFRFIRGCRFDDIQFPFNDFVAICKRLRKEHKGEALEQVAKLMQNSLYGKFGMSPAGQEYIIAEDVPLNENWSVLVDSENGSITDNVFTRPTIRDTPYMLPHWAAWITANARLELLNAQQTAGEENFYYADTDSITVAPSATENLVASGLVGQEYGQLKDEGKKTDWVCRGPKAYSYYYLNKEGKVELGVKMKGIPKKSLTDEVKLLIHTGGMPVVPFHVSRSFHSSLKSGTLGYEAHRRPTDCANLQSWEVDECRRLALPRKLGPP